MGRKKLESCWCAPNQFSFSLASVKLKNMYWVALW